VILCWESKGDSPSDASGGDCEGGWEVVNVLGEEGAGSAGVERLFDVDVDCGDNFLDRGRNFSLRAWPMLLGAPDIITVALIDLWISVFRCSMSTQVRSASH